MEDLKSQLDDLEKQGKALEEETMDVTDYRLKYKIMERENQLLKLEQKKKIKEQREENGGNQEELSS